ncbi:MAG TPA: aldo/keto reductase [Anaerolineales bacterium]|nr:aldo/keto reductase [Anaerolineales bacterium]
MSAQPAKELDFLQTAEMGLGAWAWGDRIFWHYGHGYTDDDIAEAFRTALAAGINLVDTAEIYGSGRSELLLGKFIKETEQPVVVATKFFPIPYRFTRNSVVRALRGSLDRLGLERVYLYQLHWPSPVVPIETYVEGLALAVKEGLTRRVGVSNYNIDQMQRASKVLAKYDLPLASNQVEYHLLDRSVERSGLLDRCKETGVRLIAYSPLAMGLLTGKYSVETPPPGPRGRKYASVLKDLPTLISLMTEIGKGHGEKTPGQVALNWVICKGGLPIPGAKTKRQAEQNVGAAGWRLTPEEVQALDAASDKIS